MYQNKFSNWGYKTPPTQPSTFPFARENEQIIPLRLDDVNMKLDVSDVLYDSSSVSSDSGTSQSSRVSHDFLSSITNSSILPSNVSTGWILYLILLQKYSLKKNRFILHLFYYVNIYSYAILRYICICRRMNVFDKQHLLLLIYEWYMNFF